MVHISAGVCRVSAIEELALMGKGSEDMYYRLEPVYDQDGVVTTPVEDNFHRLRDVTPKADMESIFDDIDEIEVIDEKNERVRQEKQKEQIALFEPRPLAGVVKTAYLRKRARIQAGKKVMSADERVLQSAGKKLFDEMAFSMDEDATELRDRFYESLDALQA